MEKKISNQLSLFCEPCHFDSVSHFVFPMVVVYVIRRNTMFALNNGFGGFRPLFMLLFSAVFHKFCSYLRYFLFGFWFCYAPPLNWTSPHITVQFEGSKCVSLLGYSTILLTNVSLDQLVVNGYEWAENGHEKVELICISWGLLRGQGEGETWDPDKY